MEKLMFAKPQEGLLVYTKPAMFVIEDGANCFEEGQWICVVGLEGNLLAKFRLDTLVGIVRKIPNREGQTANPMDSIQVLQ